jgi:predicted transcriptional regulator
MDALTHPNLDTLTERRKADRAQLAAAVIDTATAGGATAEIEYVRRETWINIEAARGLRLTVTLDGQSPQPDVHVLSWHMHYSGDARLSSCFPGDVNPYHRRKATVVAYGTRAMLDAIERGLRSAADGSAFEESPA